jgi:hypothetical protein
MLKDTRIKQDEVLDLNLRLSDGGSAIYIINNQVHNLKEMMGFVYMSGRHGFILKFYIIML